MGKIQSRPFQRFFNVSLEGGLQGSRIASNGGLVVLGELGKCFGFLGPLLILARQRLNWSPFKILGELWRLLTNIGKQREILRLLKLRPFDEIVQNNPGLAFKYVARNYLVRGFTVTERVSCLLHHYRRIHAALPESVLRQILQGDVAFHEVSNGGNCFALTICLSRPPLDKEGELSLCLQVDGKNVFDLSFTIVPGWVVKSEAAEILLITRLQGTKGSRPQIKLARKAFHEFFPRKLLLAALQGIADTFGIGELEAVCATNQRAYTKKCAATFKSGYDEFFAEMGMVKTAAGFYSTHIPIEGRPLASFKRRNRSRARKRRAIRQQVQSACAAFLLEAVDRAAHSFFGAVNSTPVPGAVESRLSPTSCPTPDYKIP